MDLPDYTVVRCGLGYEFTFVKIDGSWKDAEWDQMDGKRDYESDDELFHDFPRHVLVAMPSPFPFTKDAWLSNRAFMEEFKERRRNYVPGLYDAGLEIPKTPEEPRDFTVLFEGKQTVRSVITNGHVTKFDPPIMIERSGMYGVTMDDQGRPVGLTYLHPYR